MKYLPDRIYPQREQRQGVTLAMLGISLAALSIVVTASGEMDPHARGAIVYPLGGALFCFSLAYIVLQFWTRRAFEYASGALVTTGVWAISVAVFEMFGRMPELASVRRLYAVLLLAIGFAILADCRNRFLLLRRSGSGPHTTMGKQTTEHALVSERPADNAAEVRGAVVIILVLFAVIGAILHERKAQ